MSESESGYRYIFNFLHFLCFGLHPRLVLAQANLILFKPCTTGRQRTQLEAQPEKT